MASSQDTPTVSVVVPTHYRNDRLRDAIQSVRQQTHERVELIVVDDSGEGHARSVVDDDLVYIELARNEGANAARTRGIDRATGEYIQLLDDDDRLHPTKLRRHVAVLERAENVGVVYCGMTYEHGRTVRPDPTVQGNVLEPALRFGMLPCLTSTMLIDARLLDAVCPLSNRPGGDDLGMLIELARRTEFAYVEESLVVRGRLEESRGTSLGVVRGREQILREYDHLYRQFPSGTSAAARSSTYRLEGHIRLQRTTWSPGAIRAFMLALYYAPTPKAVALLGASVFGRPGLALLRRTYHQFVG